MIICKMIGGLGNQMFQWAFARSLSLRYNRNLLLFTGDYDKQEGLTKREFQLDLFKNLKYNATSKVSDLPLGEILVVTDNFDYASLEPHLPHEPDHIMCLVGYWQSEKYFKDHKMDILLDFGPSQKEIQELKPLIEPDSISIHIRRTDYLNLQEIHPVQPISYFSSGIEAIGDYNKLYVFSDEVDWCKTNLKFDRMVFMEGRSNIEDMRLMSFCKHNIISNSSFSWWAAWLNQNATKKVVAPRKWFGPKATASSRDIIPYEWITI